MTKLSIDKETSVEITDVNFVERSLSLTGRRRVRTSIEDGYVLVSRGYLGRHTVIVSDGDRTAIHKNLSRPELTMLFTHANTDISYLNVGEKS